MGYRNQQVFSLLKEQKKKKNAMATVLGISPSAVTQWEKNGTDPTLEQCLVLAKFFNVEVSEICGDEETANFIEKKEKPTDDDGLSENIKALMDFVKKVPEDKADLVLKLMRTIVEDD